jgi:hypothetical protein
MESTIHSHSKVYNPSNTAKWSPSTTILLAGSLIGLSMIHLAAPPALLATTAQLLNFGNLQVTARCMCFNRWSSVLLLHQSPPAPVVSKTTVLEAYTTRVRVEWSIRRGTLGTLALAAVVGWPLEALKLLRHYKGKPWGWGGLRRLQDWVRWDWWS